MRRFGQLRRLGRERRGHGCRPPLPPDDAPRGHVPAPTTPAPPTTAASPSGTLVLDQLPARLEADGTTITVGNVSAPHTLTVYEDPRCPICERFEEANSAQVSALARSGSLRVQYTMASFLDGNLGGGGSKRAVNALRAALAQHHFAELHTLIYQFQPPETTDGFTAAYLLELASHVPGLRSSAFDAAVRGQGYADFVSRSEKAFMNSGAGGTPSIRIDGAKVANSDAVFSTSGFRKILAEHGVA
ncbi:DsbA family protein [Actinacidiphila yeochonensis]|uniref:DsbA family protein n=1 Tax=Actinacidiphila yeochonensis TaxID=89050 RepID=UPI0018E29D09